MTDRITIVGTIGTDPERRRNVDGSPIANFRLASTRSKLDRRTGEWIDSGTSWYSVSAYRALGEHALESLRKGERVIVTGRLSVRDWESGDKRGTAVDVDAEALGHDLLWGTTTFQRSTERRAADSAASTAGSEESGAPSDIAPEDSTPPTTPSQDWAPTVATPF